MIATQNISLSYSGKPLFKNVNIKFTPGNCYGIIGANGTGKSTMLKSICGICRPYRGKVLINGKRSDKYKHNELFEGCLAMLPQDPQSLFVKKTVREDLLEMIDGRKISEEEKQERIMRIAEQCEVTELLDEHPYDLSGGEAQLLALAKVLATKPRLLLLDEPTKGLDAEKKNRFAEILRQLKREGVTVLLVTHDVEFAAAVADRCALFFRGRAVSVGSVREFFAENSFYTTAAARMTKGFFQNAVTVEDVKELCLQNGRREAGR